MTPVSNKPFKGSKVQGFNRIFIGLLFLTLELLNPLNLEPSGGADAAFLSRQNHLDDRRLESR